MALDCGLHRNDERLTPLWPLRCGRGTWIPAYAGMTGPGREARAPILCNSVAEKPEVASLRRWIPACNEIDLT